MSSLVKPFDIVPVADGSDVSEEASSNANQTYSWFRGVFFQATVVGFCAFTAPGLWNAMQSVGAGGAQTPYLVMYVSILRPLLCDSTDDCQGR